MKARLALATVLALALTAGSGSTFAATTSDFSPDGDEECTFVADFGRYVCDFQVTSVVGSLTEPVQGSEIKKKVSIQIIPSNPVVQPAFP